MNNNDKDNVIQKLAGKFKAVKDILKMNLMLISNDGKKVYFYIGLWKDKNKTFKKNWCINIYMYCSLTYRLEKNVKIDFFDIETNKLIATFKNKKIRIL